MHRGHRGGAGNLALQAQPVCGATGGRENVGPPFHALGAPLVDRGGSSRLAGRLNRTQTGREENETVRNPTEEAAQSWWSRLGSNQRPSACEADALPLSHGTRISSPFRVSFKPRRTLARARGRSESARQRRGTTGFVSVAPRRLMSETATGDDLARSVRM